MAQENDKTPTQLPTAASADTSLLTNTGGESEDIKQSSSSDNTPAAPEQTETPEPSEEASTVKTEDSSKANIIKDVNFDDFLKVKDEHVPSDAPKQKLETTPSAAPKQTSTQKQPVVSRDFSGIDEAHTPLFKNMSNEAFNTLKPLYLEHKKQKEELAKKEEELTALKNNKSQLPESYYEHPQAFVLTPEFAEQSARVKVAHQIVQHWQKQLTDIRQGSSKFDVIDFDDNGNLVKVGERPADASSEADVLNYLITTQNQFASERGKLENLSQTFRSKHQEVSSWVSGLRNQAFSFFDKPENTVIKKLADDILRNFPPAYQRNPLAELLARSLVTNNQLGALVKQLQEKAGPVTAITAAPQKQVDSKDIKKAGPVGSGTAAAAASSTKTVTFEDFEKVKQGY